MVVAFVDAQTQGVVGGLAGCDESLWLELFLQRGVGGALVDEDGRELGGGGGLAGASDQDGDGHPELVLIGGDQPDSETIGLVGAWSGARIPVTGSLDVMDAHAKDTIARSPVDGSSGGPWGSISADQDIDGDGDADLAVTARSRAHIELDWWQPDLWPRDRPGASAAAPADADRPNSPRCASLPSQLPSACITPGPFVAGDAGSSTLANDRTCVFD